MKKSLTILLLCLSAGLIIAQNTVGLLSYSPTEAYDGYNLVYPHNQPSVFLLNNCGEIVHQWDDEDHFRPGNTAYILENGKLVKCKRDADSNTDPIWAGGGGQIVEIRDWDNNLEWSFELNTANDRLHHDIAPMPNGNILMIVWDYKSSQEAIEAGRDTALLSEDALWPEYIIEVDPSTDEIVWQWNSWDHLIQDYDATKANFGVVADHPELINLNWDTNSGKADWMHANALDYNPELDQILISIPTFHEIWIIDHSTTTEQAAGHTGGISGKGGDLLYRWGNPATYNAGTADDQKVFYAHDAHWEDDFILPNDPNYGKISIFNNRVSGELSTANRLNPGFDMYKNSYPFNNGTFGPTDFDWGYTTPDPVTMYSNILSSVRLQPNGNTLICVGRWGYAFEITPEQEVVWEYKVPLIAGNPVNQGDTLVINNNFTFRMERYPLDYPAFEDRDLSAKGFIELNPDTAFCPTILDTESLVTNYNLNVYPNPASDQIAIEWNSMYAVDIEIYNVTGQLIDAFKTFGGRKYIDISDWNNGMYFIQINKEEVRKIIVNK